MIVEDRYPHNKILHILPMTEPLIPDEDRDVPLIFTQVIATYQGKYLFIHNRNRRWWELPGGGIEPGETPLDCALRELQEESCQIATSATCLGVFKVNITERKAYEYAAVYTVELDTAQPFTPNNEAERISFCDHPSQLEGNMSSWSHTVFSFFVDS